MGTYCWAPTGDKIAYEVPGTLWVADLSSEHTQIRSGNSHSPSWSPDGGKIAFSTGSGIFTIKPNGKGLKRVVSGTSTMSFHHPYWSHNGDHLVFTGQDDTSSNRDVFIATSRGDDLTNLTNTPEPLGEFMIHGYTGGWRR